MRNFTIGVIALVLSSCSLFTPEYESGLEGKPLPDIALQPPNNKLFNTGTITIGKPFVLFLFNPNCPYCQAQTVDILNHIQDFQRFQVFMIASDSSVIINKFTKYFQLDKYSNISVERDSTSQFINYFNAQGVPYLAFYDKYKKLKKVLPGKQDFPKIKQILSEL